MVARIVCVFALCVPVACASQRADDRSPAAAGPHDGPSTSIPSEPSSQRFVVSRVIEDGTEFTLSHGEEQARLRYVETVRGDEGFNAPRVEAQLELEDDGQWVPLLYVYCHDSYDDCGTLDSALSCPVIEHHTVFAAPLLALVSRYGLSSPRDSRVALDALAMATPIHLCLARLHESEPDYVGFELESLSPWMSEAEFEALFASVEAAKALWTADRAAALGLLDELDATLEGLALPADSAPVVYRVRYEIEAVRATAAGEYRVPIVGPHNVLVRWADNPWVR